MAGSAEGHCGRSRPGKALFLALGHGFGAGLARRWHVPCVFSR